MRMRLVLAALVSTLFSFRMISCTSSTRFSSVFSVSVLCFLFLTYVHRSVFVAVGLPYCTLSVLWSACASCCSSAICAVFIFLLISSILLSLLEPFFCTIFVAGHSRKIIDISLGDGLLVPIVVSRHPGFPSILFSNDC